MGKVGKGALAALLAFSLMPLPAVAYADDGGAETAQGSAALQLEEGTYVEHEAIAYVLDNGSVSLLSTGALAGAETLMEVDSSTAEAALSYAEGADDGTAAEAIGLLAQSDAASGQIVLVRDESMTTAELIAALEADSRVLFAEPNYVAETEGAEDAASAEAVESAVADAEAGSSASEDAESNEPAASDETAEQAFAMLASDSTNLASDLNRFVWGASNSGALAGIPADEAIDVDYDYWDAYNLEGDTSAASPETDPVVVAVIDSGVDASNPDLANKLWSMSDESASVQAALSAIEGADEHGCYPEHSTETKTSTTEFSNTLNDEHGTHVSGTIAAEWNGSGISGISQSAKIMAVRHDSTVSTLLACINYVTAAAEAGVNVRVSNNSWTLGSCQSQAANVAFTALGEAGVTSIMASGNVATDADSGGMTATTLKNNPYMVFVDSADPSGALSTFSDYGEATTDVVASGGTVLSTTLTVANTTTETGVAFGAYLGEEDNDAVLYESFDTENLLAGQQTDERVLTFTNADGAEAGTVVEGQQRFDGTAALQLEYDADAAGGEAVAITSAPIDLTGVAQKPQYLSYRALSLGAEGATYGQPSIAVSVQVVGDDGSTSFQSLEAKLTAGAGGDAWRIGYVELPTATDWEHFTVRISYQNLAYNYLGGSLSTAPADGTLLLDSIGVGSGLVPYRYMDGTSMASPTVAGVAAVLAASVGKDDSAKQLAARVIGSTVYDSRYEGYCSTSGYATVSGGADPGSVPVAVSASDDTLTVQAYFADAGTQVTVNGEAAAVTGCTQAGDGDGGTVATLTVARPAGFTGGEAVVGLAGADGSERTITVTLGTDSAQEYYDVTDLPAFEGFANWQMWDMVPFDGKLYVLPRDLALGNTEYTALTVYDIGAGTWSQVGLPLDMLAERGSQYVVGVTAVAYRGKLLCMLEDEYADGHLFTLSSEGEWAYVGVKASATVEELPEGSQYKYRSYNVGSTTLATDGDGVYLFCGNWTENSYNDAEDPSGYVVTGASTTGRIFSLDMDTMEVKEIGAVATGHEYPSVAYQDGVFLVSGGYAESAQYASGMGVERVVIADGVATSESVDFSGLVTQAGAVAYAVAAVDDGFVVVGPESDDGTADTYLVSTEAGSLPVKYGKRASAQNVLTPKAVGYEGNLYVLAATDSGSYRIFASTAMETDPVAGDAFSDVESGSWYYGSVYDAAWKAYMNGYAGTNAFGPADGLSRGQAACVLANVAGTAGTAAWAGEFSDMTGGEYYASNVAWAKAAGVVGGYAGTTLFGGEDAVTREQACCMLYNYAKNVAGKDVSVADAGAALSAYGDAAGTSEYAREAVAWAVEQGLFGKDSLLRAGDGVSRAEMAAMANDFATKVLAG